MYIFGAVLDGTSTLQMREHCATACNALCLGDGDAPSFARGARLEQRSLTRCPLVLSLLFSIKKGLCTSGPRGRNWIPCSGLSHLLTNYDGCILEAWQREPQNSEVWPVHLGEETFLARTRRGFA